MKGIRKYNFLLLIVFVLILNFVTGCSGEETSKGNEWIVNSGIPTVSEENIDGDIYLNDSTYDLYQMINGEWIKIGNIKGKDGINGVDGKNGIDGKDGVNGVDGKNGIDGKDGVNGVDGKNAIDGKDGVNGVDGKDGIDGVTPTISIDTDGYWVVNGQKTTIKAGENKICKPVTSDIEGTIYDLGAKYMCEVKPGTTYNFYVLSHNQNGTSNLIMDNNVYYNSDNDKGVASAQNSGQLKWYESSDNSYGPVTAMQYLHNVTKDWINVPNIIMNYTDENIMGFVNQTHGTTGYGTITTQGNKTTITKKDGTPTATFTNLKARLPMYDEVHGEGKCLTLYENGGSYYSCPSWLTQNLEIVKHASNAVEGYWTLATNHDTKPTYAWRVITGGVISNGTVDNIMRAGVRPVITVEL